MGSEESTLADEDHEGDVSFDEEIVVMGFEYPRRLHAVDLDKDGDMDFLSAALYHDEVAWSKNRRGNFVVIAK